MAYRIELTEEFHQSLKRLAPETANRILKALRKTESIDNPRSKGKALTGPLKGFWRYRVGDYRVICEIRDDELLVIALMAGHRSSIYKRK